MKMLPLILSPAAEKDVANAYQWYEEQRLGLGDDFILCLDEVMHGIATNPQIYQIVHKNIRRGILKRFPYCLFFIHEHSFIQIIAVFHVHRSPREWQNRIICLT